MKPQASDVHIHFRHRRARILCGIRPWALICWVMLPTAMAAVCVHAASGMMGTHADRAGAGISSATTGVGRVNYVAKLNQIESAGVSARNNAAIPLLALFWNKLGIGSWKKVAGGYAFSPNRLLQKQLLAGMGGGTGALAGPRYENLGDSFSKAEKTGRPSLRRWAVAWKKPSDQARFFQLENLAESRPWSPRRLPWLAAWIKKMPRHWTMRTMPRICRGFLFR